MLVHEDGRYAIQHRHNHWHRRLVGGGYESSFAEPEKWAEQGWRELSVSEQGAACEHLDGPYRALLVERDDLRALVKQAEELGRQAIRAEAQAVRDLEAKVRELVQQLHRQGGRSDGTWGCLGCDWVQDKPHAEHVADMVAAARVAS